MMDACDMSRFEKGLGELGLSLSAEQEEQFFLYYNLLTSWNSRMNLTAITGWDDVAEKHFLDSLCLIREVPDLCRQRVVDVGTGAGFPGLPLKIAFPELELVLVDSVGKKLKFLDAVTAKLGLSGVTTVHGRAEDLAHSEAYREKYDIAVSRAVSGLAALSEYCLPFVRIGGRFIAYKGITVDAECEDAKRAVFLMGGEMEGILKYAVPGSGDGRSLVCIKKTEGTPRRYPRKAGTPAKSPL